jgi:hypothetical protein
VLTSSQWHVAATPVMLQNVPIFAGLEEGALNPPKGFP